MIGKPAELVHAELVCSVLERFGGYTYSSLMTEDPELLRLLHIERLGSRREVTTD